MSKRRYSPITMADCGPGEEIYHWRNWDNGDQWVVAVTKLRDWLKSSTRVPVSSVALRPEWIEHIANHGGCEPDHLEKLMPWHTSEPAILLAGPKGTYTVVDGNHRLLKRFMMGLLDAPAYLVPRSIWRRFEIVDAPKVSKEQHEAWVYHGTRYDSPFAAAKLIGMKKSE